ncbi:MAG: class II glutamine amidotransferase [Ahrensia sp.]|nr:class II glutamine amidotransferase [Ahrensia sp.]
MCRWAAYAGPPVFIENMILAPAHSLIEQSQHASESKTATNGDGFGMAWYGERETPGLYRDILPAWADTNLRSLASQIRSPLFLAHVRAATGGGTNRDNCHPFIYKNWSFMHNGQIAHFEKMRRSLEAKLSDEIFALRHGATDSELMFLLAIEFGLNENPIAAFEKVLWLVQQTSQEKHIETLVRFTACFTDGKNLHAIRFSTDDKPPSLYFAHCDRDKSICLVSEPFDHVDRNWTSVPRNAHVVVTDGQIKITDFSPENFSRPMTNDAHQKSAA